MNSPQPLSYGKRHQRVALLFAGIVAAMVGLAYAAVPLYKIFCAKTGFAGTPQITASAPATKGTRKLIVHFDTNIGPGLPWSFAPETPSIEVRTGQTATVYFRVKNESDQPTAGRAAYNVSPDAAGSYFDKITCFCFNEQHLGPRENADMPVVFFLDPALEKDDTMTGIASVTLSYTFFAAKGEPKPVAEGRPASQSKL